MSSLSVRLRASAPVVIGGVGGSGTRVIARLLQTLGFYFGADLNDYEDNLWFTLLLKRPRSLMREQSQRSRRIHEALGVFESAMAGKNLTRRQTATLIGATIEVGLFGHDYLGRGKGVRWPIERAIKILRAQAPDPRKYKGWGWKEPNTHIFLPELAERHGSLRYIHLIRHGYEVACGNNQAQLYNWGSVFDVKLPTESRLEPNASLLYWGRANLSTIRFAQERLQERFMLINFNELCVRPDPIIERLSVFLEADITDAQRQQFASFVDSRQSLSRADRFHDAEFDESAVEYLVRLGFDPQFRPR